MILIGFFIKTIASIILKYVLGWRIDGNYESYQDIRVNKHIICYSSKDSFNSFLIGYLMFLVYDIPVVNIIKLKNFDLPIIRNIVNHFKKYCNGRSKFTPESIPGNALEKIQEQILKTIPEQSSETVQNPILDQMPELVSDQMPELVSDQLPELVSDQLPELVPNKIPEQLAPIKKQFIFLEDKINYKKTITDELSNVPNCVIITGFRHSQPMAKLFDPEPNQGIFNIMTSIGANIELLFLDYKNHTVSIHNIDLKQHNRVKLFTDTITNKLKQLSSVDNQKFPQKVFSGDSRTGAGIDTTTNAKCIICVKRSWLIYLPPIIVITILTSVIFNIFLG